MPKTQRQEDIDAEAVRKSFQEVVERVQLYRDLNLRTKDKGRVLLDRALTYTTKRTRRKAQGWLTLSFQCCFEPTHANAPGLQKPTFIAALCKQIDPWILKPIEALRIEPMSSQRPTQPTQNSLHIPFGIDRTELSLVFIWDCSNELPNLNQQMPISCTSGMAFEVLDMRKPIFWGSLPLKSKESLPKIPLRQGTVGLLVDKNSSEQFPCHVFKHSVEEAIGTCTVSYTISGTSKKVDSTLNEAQEERPVLFRFIFDKDKRYYSQACKSPQCPFCNMQCNSLQGLQQHMEASHDSFLYRFPEDHPDVVPAINVRCTPHSDFDERDYFGPSPPYELNRDLHNFYCPKRWRKARQKQYQMNSKDRANLPLYITTIPKRTPIDFKIASPRVAKTKPKQKWREPPLGPPREVVAGMPFFHARTHMPMTKQEVKLILADPKSLPDSDDEEDVDKWKDKQRRDIRNKADVGPKEREFMFNWNVFLKEHPVYADLQIPDRCQEFCETMAFKFRQDSELRRCMVSHLMMLWELALISPSHVDSCMQVINKEQEDIINLSD